MGAQVGLRVDSRRQANGWWVYITVTPISRAADGISNLSQMESLPTGLLVSQTHDPRTLLYVTR